MSAGHHHLRGCSAGLRLRTVHGAVVHGPRRSRSLRPLTRCSRARRAQDHPHA
ncbi:hypothetical protein [Kocuria sabuli]|uniref:hypothetical protein n=1 Tax=Kocuria sabuli TaxID=3071448 RepID=UPI0034D5D49C